MRRTLAWQLTARYLLVLAAVLALLGGFQYVALRRFLLSAAATRLQADTRQPLATYRRALGAGGSGAGPAADHLVRAVAGPQTRAWVVSAAGTVLAAAPGPSRLAPPPVATPTGMRAPAAPAQAGPPQRHPGQPPAPPPALPGGARVSAGLLALTLPLGPGPATAGPRLIVATPVAGVLGVLGRELRLLIVGGLGAIALGAASAALAVRQALRPLRRITTAARDIRAGDLSARAGGQGAPEEVAQLATAFDGMVDRLADAIAEERETHHQMRRLLDDASHELRTPLAAISGTLEVLQGGAGDDAESVRSGLRAAYLQARRMGGLVAGLLALARAERPEGLPLHALDLGGVLQGIRDAAERLCADHHLRWEPAGEVLPVLANAEALGGAILNVLDNAARYSPPGTDIELRAARVGDAAEVLISDHGCGIPAECLPLVFDRFYRCPTTPGRPAPPGTGLGLAIVASVVQRHGGSVAIESAVGQGSSVRLRLPCRGAAGAA